MDADALTATIKKLQDEWSKMPKDEVLGLLKKLRTDVHPTEDLLRSTRAGNNMNRFSGACTDADIKAAATDVLNTWKKAIREQKEKRKREEEEKGGSTAAGTPGADEGRDAKRVKAENGTASPATNAKTSPADDKPKSSAPTSTAPTSKDDKSAVKAEREVKPLPSRKMSVNESEYVDSSEPTLDTIDTSLTTPRTAKSDGIADRLKADTAGEPDAVRDSTVVMMYNAVAMDSNAEWKLLKERAADIEQALYEQHDGDTGKDYRSKVRSLFLNIKTKGNEALRDRITKGLLPGKELVNMSNADIASSNIRAINEQIAEQNLFKAKSVGETQAETDAFKCGKCGERKTTYYQMQTRSADEPMTTFVTCKNCQNRWKFS